MLKFQKEKPKNIMKLIHKDIKLNALIENFKNFEGIEYFITD